MTTFPTRERVLEVIETHAPDVLKAVLRDNLSPAIALILQKTDDENIAVGQSKIGGAPDVPSDFAWPTVEIPRWQFFKRVREEKPLGFLGQFNLAEVAPFDLNHELPSSGTLSFFYAIADQPWSSPANDSYWRVFYWPENGKLERRIHDKVDTQNSLPSHAAIFATKWMCPDNESWQTDNIDLDDNAFEQWNETFLSEIDALFAEDLGHHLLGYGERVQGDISTSAYMTTTGDSARRGETYQSFNDRTRSEVSKWRLLFQLNSQDSPDKRGSEWMWGDVGMLYFCIREDDLKVRKFDNVYLEFQCH